MFWRLGFAHTSPVDQLLESDDFTLQQLLEENDILQECKQLNKKLIDYLATPEQVAQLIDYVVHDPPEDSEDNVKFIYPYKASEVLASDLNAVYDCLFANEVLVDKLFSFLDRDQPLNTLLAGYFVKIVSTLLARRSGETFAVMESKSIVPQMLKHLNTYSVLELLLKVVSEVEVASIRGQEFDWLYKINMVEVLISKLDKDLDSEVQANASVALVGFVGSGMPTMYHTSIPSGQSRFTDDLLQSACVGALLDRTLHGSQSTLDHGLAVLVALVRHCTSSARPPAELHAVVNELMARLAAFVEILKNPPAMEPIVNSTGLLDPPLGSSRLKILEVVHELVKLKSPVAEEKMVELKVLPICFDLMLQYAWHSFLHNLVRAIVEDVLHGENVDFKRSLFADGDILGRIMAAHKENNEAVEKPKGCRKGYMGQLRLISNGIMHEAALEGNAWMSEYVDAGLWPKFVAEELEPANERNDRQQLGTKAARSHQDEKSDDDFVSPPATVAPPANLDWDGGDDEDASLVQQGKINPYDHMMFRPHNEEGEDLFDGEEEEEEEDVEEEEGADAHGDSYDADFVEEEAGVVSGMSGLSVDSDVVNTEAEIRQKNNEGTLPDSPDYNDINYWKPAMNWFTP